MSRLNAAWNDEIAHWETGRTMEDDRLTMAEIGVIVLRQQRKLDEQRRAVIEARAFAGIVRK